MTTEIHGTSRDVLQTIPQVALILELKKENGIKKYIDIKQK